MPKADPHKIFSRKKNRLKNKLKKEKMTYDEICKEFQVSRLEARELLIAIRQDGFEVPHDFQDRKHAFWIPSAPMRENQETHYKLKKDAEGYIKFGIVSDTHFGSKFSAEKELNDMYRHFKEEKVSLVLHAGDLTEGNGRLYRGQLFEMSTFGYNNLVDLVEKNYPKKEGIKTAIISGNHDMSFYTQTGADLVKDVCSRRKDFDYLGQYSSKIFINDIEGYIVHPSGGMAYARSYKIQKMIEAMETKPAFLIRGHCHVAMSIPYLGVQGIEAGAFQFQTYYLKRKGLHPEVGGYIITLKTDGLGKITEFNPKWVSYKK